ncbi:MAG: OmpA family protein [Pseudomonadales bacterium]
MLSSRPISALSLLLLTTLAFFCAVGTVSGEPSTALRSQLFGATDGARTAAIALQASDFAPGTFADAEKNYASAEKKLARAKSIESIVSSLAKANSAYLKAAEIARSASEKFAEVIQAREDAGAAQAGEFAPSEWGRAEKDLIAAIKYHESGREELADKRGSSAESAYRAAELAAIKNNYLAETRRLIEEAERQKVARYAPRTLDEAKALLLQAERELNENRYDTDKARSIARRAKVEAGHAIYIKQQLHRVREEGLSEEALWLEGEAPLLTLANALDMDINLDKGPTAPTAAMAAKISALRADAAELVELEAEMAELETEMRLLNEKLGSQSSRLMRQAEIKNKITLLESMFAFDEARVYRQGGNLLLRMVGLNFQSGQSVIQSKHFALLTQLIKALKQFPGATIMVEGHTDSFGSDAVNRELSQQRANAVAAYLAANMPEEFFKQIEAVGYGETRPVANNETAEGRTINRRIDLLIRPDF